MAKLDAALMQLANKAMSGEIKSLREVIRLIEKLQEQEPYLNAPEFVVNFIDPPNRKPKRGGRWRKMIEKSASTLPREELAVSVCSMRPIL
jgi:hypothetical protein